MLTTLELEEITGIPSYETLGLTSGAVPRTAARGVGVCRAVLHRHAINPPAPAAGVRVREVTATSVGLLCSETTAPTEGEAFTLGIERKGVGERAGGGAAGAQPLWVKCATFQRVATGWSGRCLLGARFIERTEAPKLPAVTAPVMLTMRSVQPGTGRARGTEGVADMLFEQHPLALAFVTPDHRFARANRAFCALTGYSAGELAGLTFVEITHPDDVGADLQHAARLFAGEMPEFQSTKRYIHKAGRAVPVELSASAVRDAGGKIVGAIATVRAMPREMIGPNAECAHELERLRRAVLG